MIMTQAGSNQGIQLCRGASAVAEGVDDNSGKDSEAGINQGTQHCSNAPAVSKGVDDNSGNGKRQVVMKGRPGGCCREYEGIECPVEDMAAWSM